MKYFKSPAIADIEVGRVVEIVREIRKHGDTELEIVGTARLIRRRPSYRPDNIPYVLQERQVKRGEPTCNIWSSQRWEVQWVTHPRRKAGEFEAIWVHFHVGLRKDVESEVLVEKGGTRRSRTALLPRRKVVLFVDTDLLGDENSEAVLKHLRQEVPATVILHASESHSKRLWVDGYTPDVQNALWTDDIQLWLDMHDNPDHLVIHGGIELLPTQTGFCCENLRCENLNIKYLKKYLEEEE